MLSIGEALARCLAVVPEVVVETVSIEEACGRVLAEDVDAPSPLPPWDNSAMDGFAVLAADFAEGTNEDCCDDTDALDVPAVTLQVLETIPAGKVGTQIVLPGTCARIMTGAPMPAGADSVVMREYTEDLPEDRVRITAAATSGQHVRRMGEEVHAGEVVLRQGQALTPPAVGLCAAVGRAHVQVARQPRVAIVSTGDEIIPPGQPLGAGQIHSSNTHALASWIKATGAIAVDCGIAPDDLEATRAAFRSAMDCDVIVSTGGVSVGDFDVVRQAMTEEGAEMQFWKVRIKPGKPLAFGVIGGRPAFGLPGNPVSCQVGFLQFVRPFLRQSMGDARPFLPVVDATLATSVKKRPGRAELVRVALNWEAGGLIARCTGSQSSGQQTSMVLADGLMLLPPDQGPVQTGSPVKVQLLNGHAEHPGYPW